MKIPTTAEINAWVAALKTGHAVTEIMPSFVEGYRRLLDVAEKARACVEPDREGIAWGLLDRGTLDASCARLEALAEAMEALEAPMPETEGK